MLQGLMLPGQMSPRELSTNLDDLTNQPSKFGLVRSTNIRDMTSFLCMNYRDPKNKKTKFAKPKQNKTLQPQVKSDFVFCLASWQVGAGLQSN